MKTTLEIPDRLFKRVKAKAALEGVKMKDVVANALTGYLAESRPRGSGKAEPCPFPLIQGEGGPLLAQMDNETVARLEAEDDLARYGRSLGR